MGQTSTHSAFLNNGFAVPSQSLATFHFTFGRHYDSGFDLGINIGQGGQGREVGTNDASYNFVHVGFYAAYDLLDPSNLDLKIGSTLGYGGTELEILSTNQSGRITERAFVWEPSLALSYKLASKFRLGVVASYLLPFGESRSTKGTDLGAQKISPRGASVGLQLIFGRFGEEAEASK